MITRLDHVNLQTAQLSQMIAWYEEVLHLRHGFRPASSSVGAWLYAGEHPIIHLVEVDEAPPKAIDLALEHVAFRATGLSAFIARLDASDHAHRVNEMPEIGLVQVNVWDPDGNHLHVDFGIGESDGDAIEAFASTQKEA